MVHLIDGAGVAEPIRHDLRACVETLVAEGVRPGLATVLMSDDPVDEEYVDVKRKACEAMGIAGVHRRVDPDAPAEDLYDVVRELNRDEDVHGIFVQVPLPAHVSMSTLRSRIDPRMDIDCFHPTNVGRLVGGNPRYEPATPLAVLRLLTAAEVDVEGAHVVIVGRSDVIGKPLANMLVQKAPARNATVTICHSQTESLAEHTARADVLVTAAGVPELVDGSMISPGAVVIDVSVNHVGTAAGAGERVVGDVEFESAAEQAAAITPVPGGVGPMTVTMLLHNTVAAASAQTSTPVDLP